MVRGVAEGALRTGPKECSTRSFRAHLSCVSDNSDDGNDVDVYDDSDGGATAVLQCECVVIMAGEKRPRERDTKRERRKKTNNRGGKQIEKKRSLNWRTEKEETGYTCATVAGKIKGYGEDTLYMYSLVFAGILLETSIQAGH